MNSYNKTTLKSLHDGVYNTCCGFLSPLLNRAKEPISGIGVVFSIPFFEVLSDLAVAVEVVRQKRSHDLLSISTYEYTYGYNTPSLDCLDP